jgi:primosomal protein N' (replication factor Y)
MGVNMPAIEVVNAKSLDTVKLLGVKLLTPQLQEAMLDALQNRKQIILFQNRRGYAPFQLCTVCGWVPQCKNCSVSLTYHKSTDKLHCHYCGLKAAVTHSCPQCGSTKPGEQVVWHGEDRRGGAADIPAGTRGADGCGQHAR